MTTVGRSLGLPVRMPTSAVPSPAAVALVWLWPRDAPDISATEQLGLTSGVVTAEVVLDEDPAVEMPTLPIGLSASVEVIGSRPCSANVDPERETALEDRFYAVAAEVLEKKPEAGSGSTDCNIPWSQGIPGIVFGCCKGEGAHTREEYMEIDSLKTGMTLAIKFLISYL